MEKKIHVRDLCGRHFSTKQTLLYHTEHNVCQKEQKYICPDCGFVFKRKEPLMYHVNHHVCHKKIQLLLRTQSSTKSDHPLALEQLLTHSKEELAQLVQLKDTEIRVLKENPKIVNNFNIVNFGNEDPAEIQMKCPNLLANAMIHVGQSIPYITKQIHFNPEMFP